MLQSCPGDINMFFVLEFLIYLIFISFWVYSLLEQTILYTSQGGKIGKYIKKYNLKNIPSSYEKTNFIKFYNYLKSPQGSKSIKYSIIATTVILAIKLALSIDFIFSNYFYITIFDKDINLYSIFNSKYIFFKLFYFFVFYIFYQVNSFKIIDKFLRKNVKTENISNDVIDIAIIGEDENGKVGIERRGLYQNVLITGSIGSGKTSTVITNLLDYLVKNDIPGLILDVKGNFIKTVKEVVNKYNKNTKMFEITDKSGSYNPIDIPYLSAYELSERIKKTLEILSDKKTSDSYWLDKAQSYIKDFIILIRNYNDYVSFTEIHKLCLDNEYLNQKIDEVKKNVIKNHISSSELFDITNSISNLKKEFLTLDDRTKNIIRSEITRMTDLFVSNYDVCNNFCCKNTRVSFFDRNYYCKYEYRRKSKACKSCCNICKIKFSK